MQSDTFITENCLDWTIASDVQQRFMQRIGPTIDTLDYSARCRQAQELGGDCYDFIPLANQRVALAVGDASGKGLAAALMISSVQSSLRTAVSFLGNDGPAVLGIVNRQIHASSLADRYATLFYSVFDGVTRTMRYVNAGQNPPMVIRRDGSVEWLETGGAPVGMFPDWPYEDGTVQLDSGDIVLAFTDGVIECVNQCGEEWGVEGLRRAAVETRAECAGDIVDGIFRSMDEFSLGRQNDDATVAILRVQ